MTNVSTCSDVEGMPKCINQPLCSWGSVGCIFVMHWIEPGSTSFSVLNLGRSPTADAPGLNRIYFSIVDFRDKAAVGTRSGSRIPLSWHPRINIGMRLRLLKTVDSLKIHSEL